MCFGLLVIIVGVIFLLQNLGVLSGSAWGILWPVLLIALGFCFLLGHEKRRRVCGSFREKMRDTFGEKKEEK